MDDKFGKAPDELTAPGRNMFAITPHATDEVTPIPKAIRANTAGTVALRTIDGTEDVSVTMAVGEVLHVRVQFVRAVGTTATLHGIA